MNHSISVNSANFELDGKKIISQIYIQGILDINGLGEYREPDSYKLFVAEENNKSGVYQLSPNGLIELLPCKYDKIDATMICGKVFILGKKFIQKGNYSHVVYDYYYFDRFKNKLSDCLIKNVFNYQSLKDWSNVILFEHDDGNQSLWSMEHMKVFPICIEKDFSDIQKIDELDDGNREIYLIKGIKENGKSKDKLLSLFFDSSLQLEETNISADEIHYIDKCKLNSDFGCWFFIKSNGKVNFLWHPYFSSDKPIVKQPKLNAIDAIIVQDELVGNGTYANMLSIGLTDELNSQLAKPPIVLIIVENENNKKAIACIDDKQWSEFKFNLLTPYDFDEITHINTNCEFQPEIENDDIKCIHFSPVYSEFLTNCNGKQITLYFNAKTREVTTQKPQKPQSSDTFSDKLEHLIEISRQESSFELPF